MDIIVDVIPTIIEYTAAPIIRHISYPFNYKTNVTKLEEKVDELKTAQQCMQCKVDAEKRKGKLIVADVEKWLEEADGMVVKEKEGIVLDREKAKKKCFLGFCPNLKIRYQVSRKAEKKAGEVVKLKQKKEELSAIFSYTAPPQFIVAFSAGDYMALESRTSISKEIMNVLAAADVSTVGLYGDGGVGKTRLAKEVARQAMEEKLIDGTTVVTVTQDVNVKNIQGQIADMLGLKLEEESVAGRAGRLFGRLKNKDNAKNEDKAKNDEKILIVFDDLWEKLDLQAIGIPSDMQRCRGCKILLTSRNIDVLKDGMNCQKNFRVRTLDKDEAWGLFQRMVENSFENDDRQSTAKEVAEMCVGLPVAIVTVASTLRNKSLLEWKDALQQLKHPYFKDLSGMQTAIYKPIKFSYDYLKTDELRTTFLLCSQMGYRATTKDLLKYGIGRSLFRNVSKLNEAQDRVFSLVQQLKAVCLLLEGETSEELVMHDVVREVGRWIAASKVLIVNDENQMKQLVDSEDKLKPYSEIWLSNNIDELPEEIQCLNLALFHVDSKNPTLKIPDKLFIGMRQLTTLSFSDFSFPSLPSSFDSLGNLKTLCIHESPELGDVSMVGKPRRLEVLSFVKSMIRHLPIEIGELSKLKLLDLSDCNKLIVIPPSVISKLSQLEGLHMGNSFDGWGSSEGGFTSANVSELKQLTSLTSLDIGIRDARPISACGEIFSNKKLCTYRISIGDLSWENGGNKTSKALKLKFTDDTNDVGMEELGVMELLKESEEVCFDGLKLKALVPGEPFRKLKFIKVSRCIRLEYLFSFFVAQGLSQLLEIKVEECDKIKEIVAEEEALVNRSGACTNMHIVFSQLQSLSLRSLPNFKSFCSKEKLEDPFSTQSQFLMTPILVFDEQILFPNLKELFLQAITCEVLWSGRLQLPTIGISFQKLIELRVRECRKLKYLFPATLVKCLGGLKKLQISYCYSMEEVILVVGRTEEQIAFPSLIELSIGWCPALKSFTSSSCEKEILEDENVKQRRPLFDETVAFPNLINLYISGIPNIDKIWHRQLAPDSLCKLRQLYIFGCDKLRNIFSSNLVEMGRFQNLENLKVTCCGSLEVIFEVDDEGWTRESNHDDRIVLPISFHFKVLDLDDLPKLRHIWSFCCKDPSPPRGRGTDCLVLFQNLEKLAMSRCGSMEEVVGRTEEQIVFPLLKELSICWCPALKSFTSSSCEEEILDENAKQRRPFFDKTVAFPNLINLYISGIPNIDKIWHRQLAPDSFCKLRQLCIFGCDKLRNIFSSNLVEMGRFQNLEKLDVRDCNSLEVIFEVDDEGWTRESNHGDRTVLPISFHFKVLDLMYLPKLRHIWSFCCKDPSPPRGRGTDCLVLFQNLEKLEIRGCGSMEEVVLVVGRTEEQIVFPSLKKLWIGYCPALKSFTSSSCEKEILEDENAKQRRPFFDKTVAFPNLTILSIGDIDKIWHRQLAPDSFCKLRELEIWECHKLRNIFSSNLVEMGRFQNLEKLDVSDCNSLEVIFEVDNEGWTRESNHGDRTILPISFHFKVLDLDDLPKLRHIWSFCCKDPSPPGGRGTDPYDFSNLQRVYVYSCPALENVFPRSIATHLPKLEYLGIEKCDKIEEIVAKGEEINNDNAAAAPCFRFPELTTVELKRVPNLRTWYPGMHTSEFPKLKKAFNFVSSLLSLSHQKAMSNLEELELNGYNISHPMMKWKEFTQPNLFPRLKLLTLSTFKHVWVGLPTGFVQELHSLKELSVHYCGFEQLFIGCDCEHICGLEHVSPLSSAPCFQNLITLRVSDCNSLITLLFTNSDSAKTLTDDQQEEKEITTTTITFPNLHCLELVNLENLTCFFSGNYNLNFPSLDQVVVKKCPKMRLFSPPELQLSTPKLQHVVYEVFFTEEKHWEGNLNSTINHLYTQMVGWGTIRVLKLSEFPQLKQTRHALTLPQKNALRALETLVLDDCSLFSNAVPFNLLPFMKELRKLHVRNCDSIETVFILESLNADDHHSLLPCLSELSLRDLPRLTHICNMNPQGILEFQRLQILKIHNCSSLRNVLTPSMALSLVGLKKIEIRNCTLLEEIVTKEEKKEGEPAAIHGEDAWVIFPQLRCIVLESLPNLISINSGYGILEFSRLEEITIQNCPNLKPSISSILREQVLQNTEVQILQSSSTPNDNKTILPKLQKLGLDWNDTMEEIRHGQLQVDFIRQLKVLEITGFPDGYEAFPSLFLERFTNLKNLKISNALFKEIVICEGTDDEDTNEGGALKKLRKLTLSKLPKLLHFANPGSTLGSILRSLKSLEVSDCGILGPLVPPTTSFQCLQTLEISRCHQVLHLISSSVAKSLLLLTSMSITECKNIEQVAVDEENEAVNEVIFEKLERLELHSLPNLVGFSLWNCAFTFPALEEVCVRECPKMKIFSQGDVRTPKLGRVLLTEGKNKWCWKGSLNATIQKLFTDQVVLQSNLPSLPKQLDMYDETAQPGTLNDQENPAQNEDSSTAKDFENGTFFQEQKSPQAIHQDETIPPSSGMSGGKKAGIVFGVLIAAGLIAVGGFVHKKRQTM